MVDGDLPCLRVDFLYGGPRSDGTWVVYLSRKSGDRSNLSDDLRRQFNELGLEPSEGMQARLFDPASDRNDDGFLCDMEVDATLTWKNDGRGWRAVYDGNAMTWVPIDGGG